MLKVNHLSVRFSDETLALNDINIEIDSQKCVGIVGENGAGKSTLLSSILGLVPKTEGEISVGGVRLCKESLKDIRKNAGMVFQNPDDQLFMPTVYEDILFGAKNYGMDLEDAKQRANTLMDELGVSQLKDKLTHNLSWGEKRKVAIASVLILNPSLIMLDEPTSFLDPKSCESLKRILNSIDCTKIIATHDLILAKEMCDRLIILKDGKKAADGCPSELLSNKDLLKECNLL